MTELATKSANGTYTDDVDRKALQDEISALKDEINRIADGTDFNGIKLLDGSMGVGTAGIFGSSTAGGAAGNTDAATKFTFEAPEGYKVEIKTVAKGTASSASWGCLLYTSITPKQQERLQKLQLGAPVNALKEKKLKEQAAVIARQLREVGRTRLTAGEVHPGTVITIGDCKLNIVKKEISCSFYYLDGEIRKGIR